jgi:hypothetical protein
METDISGAYFDNSEVLCNGDYTLDVTVLGTTVSEEISITDGRDCEEGGSSSSEAIVEASMVSAGSFTLGAQNAAEPSALDLDAGEMYSSSERVAHAADLDLAYGVMADGEGYLMTPMQAELNNFGDWGGDDAAYSIIVPLDGADFDAIEVLSDVPDFDDADMVDEIAVESGLVLLVMTMDDGLFVISVDDVESGEGGNVTIKALTPEEEAAE